MDDALGRLAEDALVELALQDLAVADDHLALGAVVHLQVDRGQELAEHLAPRPLTVVALRLGDSAVKAPVPHHQVHELPAIQGHVVPGDAIAPHQRVLYNANHGKTITRAQNLVRDGGDLLQLRGSLVALRAVHVHLVAVKVGIVRSRHGHVQAERLPL